MMFDATENQRGGHLPLEGTQEPEANFAQSTKLLALLETALLVLALILLGFADGGLWGWVKLLVFGAAAFLVSFLTYKTSIEKGTTLAAKGFALAGLLGAVSVLLVGTAFFIATASGLSIAKVEALRHADHVQAVTSYVETRVAVANDAANLASVVATIPPDLAARTEQELETGRGPVARKLESLTQRAEGILAELSAGLADREDVLKRLTEGMDDLRATADDEGLFIWKRRAKLQSIDGDIRAVLAELDQAVPLSLLQGYAEELNTGVSFPGNPRASASISQIMGAHATTLNTALAERGFTGAPHPVFPDKTGAMDTFAPKYIAKFAPVYLLAFVIDLLFPITLWAYAMMSVLYLRDTYDPKAPTPAAPRSDFDRITGAPIVDRGLFERHEAKMGSHGSHAPKQDTSSQDPLAPDSSSQRHSPWSEDASRQRDDDHGQANGPSRPKPFTKH